MEVHELAALLVALLGLGLTHSDLCVIEGENERERKRGTRRE